jgi:hypothetical protein
MSSNSMSAIGNYNVELSEDAYIIEKKSVCSTEREYPYGVIVEVIVEA